MAKRRYKSNCSKFSIHLVVNGEHMVHEFKGKDVYSKERYTDVEDKDIQKALEATTSFGVYFYKSNEFDWMEEEEKKLEKEKAIINTKADKEDKDLIEDVEDDEDLELVPEDGLPLEEKPEGKGIPEDKHLAFKVGADAKHWLNQTMGIPVARLTNKAKMVSEALLLGYTIEFEVN